MLETALVVVQVVVLLSMAVAVFAFWKAQKSQKEMREIMMKISALIDGSSKTERENNG